MTRIPGPSRARLRGAPDRRLAAAPRPRVPLALHRAADQQHGPPGHPGGPAVPGLRAHRVRRWPSAGCRRPPWPGSCLFSLPGGAVADAYERRRLLLITAVGLGSTSLALGLLALLAAPPLALIYLIAFLAAAISTIDGPARRAAMPRLVAPERLPAAYVLNQSNMQASSVVGPAIGGLLIAFIGLPAAYLFDAVTFAAAFAAALAIAPMPLAAGVGRPTMQAGHRRPAVRAPHAGHPGVVRHRPLGHDLRPAGGPLPDPRPGDVPRRPGHPWPADVRARRRRRAGHADRRVGRLGAPPGPRDHRRRDRVGPRHLRLRAARLLPAAGPHLPCSGRRRGRHQRRLPHRR